MEIRQSLQVLLPRRAMKWELSSGEQRFLLYKTPLKPPLANILVLPTQLNHSGLENYYFYCLP